MRRSVEILAAAVVLLVNASPVMALIQFNDGGVWDIDYEINDDVWVDYLRPGMQTTVNLLAGGSIIDFLPHEYNMLQAFEDSRINIPGGLITYLRAYDSSQVNLSGGSISYCQAYGNQAFGNNRINISGGSINAHLEAFGNSQMSISGGSINCLETFADSRVNISGGSFVNNSLYVYSNSEVDIFGGSFQRDLRVRDNGILTIHGSDFAVDGTPFGYGELTSIFGGYWDNEPYRHLTGTLFSGESIANDFRIALDAKIVLVPEPATLLLLGLGGLALLRNRRSR